MKIKGASKCIKYNLVCCQFNEKIFSFLRKVSKIIIEETNETK